MSLFNLLKSGPSRNQRTKPQTCKPTVEALEDRRLLACTASVIEYCGGASNDYIKVESATSVTGTPVVRVSVWLNKTGPIGTPDQTGRAAGVTIKAEGGDDIIEVFDFNRMNGVTIEAGGGSNDKLIATTSASNTWNITSVNAGRLNNNMTFTGVENLTGSQSGGDAFLMGCSLTRIGRACVSGSIDGRNGQASTLDYSSWTNPVRVNLLTGSASGVAAGLTGRVMGIRNMIGGSGSDSITGNGEANVLRGGGGDDWIYGDAGRDVLVGGSHNDHLYGQVAKDILIGGSGGDWLEGGVNDDVLIDGWTAYDQDGVALDEIGRRWAQAVTRQDGVNQLWNGFTGTNGTFYRLGYNMYHDGESDLFVTNMDGDQDYSYLEFGYWEVPTVYGSGGERWVAGIDWVSARSGSGYIFLQA